MNLLLKVIDQNLSECEQTKVYPLGDKGYSYVAKVNNGKADCVKTLFESSVDDYFAGVPCSSEEKENVQIVVYGENRTHIIKKHEVGYIVNSEGKTMEKIYGQYHKY